MTTRVHRNDIGIVRSVSARILSVFLYLMVVTADGMTEDWQQEMEVIFPEEEFSRFSDCLYLDNSTECIAYVTISEFNITVDGVAEDRPRVDKQKPCTYFTCDSNITGSEGELICRRQEESTVCNNRFESSFSREPVKTRRGPTCAVLFLSEEFEIFTFDQLSSFESCSTSCLCETPASTTQTIASGLDISTVKPFVADAKITEKTIAIREPSSVYSAQNISSNTTVTTISVASTENSTDILVSPTITTSLSVPINETTVTKETVDAGGNNDTLVANDTNVTSQTATFVTVGVVFAVVAIGVIVAGVVCYFRRRAAAQRPTGHEELEMINIPYERSSANVMRQCCRDNEHDPDTYSPLVGAVEDTTTSHV